MNNLIKLFMSLMLMASGIQSFALTKPPAPTCQMQTSSVDAEGHTVQYYNGACQREWSLYNTQMAYWNQAEANGQNTSYKGITEPVKPNTPTCAADDYSCQSSNQSAINAYNTQKDLYDRQQQQANQAAAAAADAAKAKAAASAQQSASGAYGDVSNQNKVGSALYQVAAAAAGAAGAQYLATAAGCSPNAACTAAFTILAQIAFAQMGAGLSQAKRMDIAAYSACSAANQTAASQTNCGTPPTPDTGNPYDPTNPNNASINASGNCPSNSSQSCAGGSGVGGRLDSKTAKLLSDYAASKNNIAADGTVTLPDGTKITADKLLTKEGMLKAGLTPAQIDSLMKQLGSNAASLNAKKELNEHSKTDLTFGDATSAGSEAGKQLLNGNKTGIKDLEKRKPSSEGLTRIFNGEAIGASGDDIFNMMNRRYKLKSAQDSFMAPK